MKENAQLSEKIADIVRGIRPVPADISCAIINLRSTEPEICGYHMDKFIYPASVYKAYVAAEVLRQVYQKQHALDELIEITSPNDVDTDVRLFPKNSKADHRPLLKAGDMVTIDYLLDLVFSRSDNTAANTLIDLVGRESINNHIIQPNGWDGSYVTRKYLDRLKEDKTYRVADVTVSNARHLAEFLYKIDTDQLINEWVSTTLKKYMHTWNRGGRTGLYINEFKEYYRKGGWLEVNGYKINFSQAIQNVWNKGHAINRWSNDAGVVTGTYSHYAIAVLTLTKTKWPWAKFPMKKFSKKIHRMMEECAMPSS
jgi:beta-lactamase class A